MRSFDWLFNPQTVAVIGASRKPGKVGHEILKNLLNNRAQRKIYPVNPNASNILGLSCYSSVLEISEDVELAIITVPAEIVPRVLEECGEKGVKGAIIISAGFKEIGPQGAERESEILKIARKHKMRVLGPNCLGVIDTHSSLNATFSTRIPPKGNLAIISQSGAILTSIIDKFATMSLGLSRLVSLGNKSDIDESDMLWACGADENTKAILLYIEDVKDGGKFLEIARNIAVKKPVVVLKPGISEAGVRAASSHTGAVITSDLAYDLAFRRTGLLRALELSEFFNVACLLSKQPLPKSNEVVIVTNAGGVGVIAADACEKFGLKLAPIPAELANKLRLVLPPTAALGNPIDILGDAQPDRYYKTAEIIASYIRDCNFLFILTPQAMTKPLKVAEVLLKFREKFHDIPVLASFIGGEQVKDAITLLIKSGVPNFNSPEEALRSLSLLTGYIQAVRRVKIQERPVFPANKKKVERILSIARKEGRVNLTSIESLEVLKAYGIPVPKYALVRSEEGAMKIMREFDYPVVLKISSPDILHKTDIGCVKLNIKSKDELLRAYNEILYNARYYFPRAVVYGVEIHEQVEKGIEVIIGAHRDPIFGPIVMFGAGGIYTEVLKDVSFKLAPLSKLDAQEILAETKIYTILRGIRGEKPYDIDSLVTLLLRVSQLVGDFKEIAEMDINPVFVYNEGRGCIAVDCRITLEW